MTDQPYRVEHIDPDPKKLRAAWQTVKAKHTAAITAKGIKFKRELGPLLDMRAAQYRVFDNLANEQSKAQVKEESGKAKPMSVAQKKSLRAEVLAAVKPMRSTTVTVKEVAEDYQVKIAGLGNPAEEALGAVLRALVLSMNEQIKSLDGIIIAAKR